MSDYRNLYETLYGGRAETLTDAITKFKSLLEPTDRQVQLVSQRQNNVRERIAANSQFDIEKIALHGSYARDTQIKPLVTQTQYFYNSKQIIDVDALLILQATAFNLQKYWDVKDGGVRALQDLFSALSGFQGMKVAIDRPAVTVSWSDMKMEVCPAFPAKGGGYLIPASYGTDWIHTDPLTDAELLTKANQERNGQLKPLTKMLKSWDRHFGKRIGSFPVEVALYHSTFGYTEMYGEIINFFTNLLSWDGSLLETPSKVGKKILINLSTDDRANIQHSKSMVEAACIRANRGDHKEAIYYFGKAFGKPFPGA